ncbi:MAG TPA: transglycosylase domain-containing protein, partial [Geminicoccaceae bacterium]|nr:transglycosylase domain-containing protein [Geminicoccaceae bacterium]
MSTIDPRPQAGNGQAARPTPAAPGGAADPHGSAGERGTPPLPPLRRRPSWWSRLVLGALALVVASALGWAAAEELRTSELQAGFLSRFARGLTFAVEPGPNPDMRYPDGGPYDRRLGYTLLPFFADSLGGQGFVVERQARASARLDAFVARGGFPVFHEKTRAGLSLIDHTGRVLFAARFPERVYERFEQVPPVLVETLLFIENRELLDRRFPRRNPAVEWDRFAAALATQLVHRVDPHVQTAGGSTLATQIEKYRHSPEGRTTDATEKLRQMLSASVRAYLDGVDTHEARRRLVVAYLSSTPLSARPGFGEVNGIGDGLWAWYGTDFEAANRVLAGPAEDAGAMLLRGVVYKQVLSLLLAQRRPSFYLLQDRNELATLTDTYLRLLRSAGVIDRELAEVALAVRLSFEERPPLPEDSFLERKAASAVRRHLLSLLKLPSLYTLDRLDLTVETTLDLPTQRRVTDVLRELTDPTKVVAHGLDGGRLLGRGDPARVSYSVTLYERGADANHVRVQADNLDQPLDLNEGTKLELGSTAKLRTLVTYLEIVAALHGR